MSTDGVENNISAEEMSRVQRVVVAQLFQVVATMHHIDELFQWFAYAMTQYFNMQVTQLWANQLDQGGRFAVQLRTIVRQDLTVPEPAVINDQIAYIAQLVTSERRSYKPQPVDMFFPSYRAALLKRYGLNYCCICFMSGNVGLPVPDNLFFHEKTPVPLALSTLFFMRYLPHPNFMYTVNAILEQAIALAGNRGLLLPIGGTVPPPVTPLPVAVPPITMSNPMSFIPPLTPRLQPIHSLEQLIPHRKQNADLLLADNPFVSTAVSTDKRARRLYAAIDDQTNVAGICRIAGLNLKEAYMSLQELLKHQRIEIYDPSGRLIEVLPPA